MYYQKLQAAVPDPKLLVSNWSSLSPGSVKLTFYIYGVSLIKFTGIQSQLFPFVCKEKTCSVY